MDGQLVDIREPVAAPYDTQTTFFGKAMEPTRHGGRRDPFARRHIGQAYRRDPQPSVSLGYVKVNVVEQVGEGPALLRCVGRGIEHLATGGAEAVRRETEGTAIAVNEREQIDTDVGVGCERFVATRGEAQAMILASGGNSWCRLATYTAAPWMGATTL
ncbi:MAG: hypothetical protein RhofKO_31880 [Rhodothermales bacterium]